MSTSSEDREEIRDLVARYCLYIDTGQADRWAALWTEDGEFDLGDGHVVSGRAALGEHAAQMPAGQTHHLAINLVIDVDKDQATCEESTILTSKGAIIMVARVHDECRRVDGAWRLAKKSFTVDPM
jgi:uncharacterized protein (TIGR02246 family)